jgi:TolB-like protein
MCLILCFVVVFILPLPESYCMTNSIEDAIKLLSADLKTSLNVTENQAKIALLPFSMDKSEQWSLGSVIFERLRTELGGTNGISLIDRELSIRTMAEFKIVLEKGLLKPEDAINFAKQTEANFLITGHITDLGTMINLNVFVWDTNNGNLLPTKNVQIRKTAEIISLISPSTKIENIEPYSIKWQSKILPYHILGLMVNDFNNDRINELTLIADGELKLSIWDGFCFVEKSSMTYFDTAKIRRNQSDLRIINKDDTQKIYISTPNIESSIWKWDKESPIRCGELPFLLLSAQKDFMLIGTLKDNRNYFYGEKTYLMQTADRVRIEKPIPKDFYSIAIGDVNSDGKMEWVIVDDDNILRIYSDDMNLVWQSPMLFGMGLVIADLDNNGKSEIIGTSASPQGKKDSLIILEWDGASFVKKWESQPINGSISAMCVGDPNMDGIDELVIAVWIQEGTEIGFYTAN